MSVTCQMLPLDEPIGKGRSLLGVSDAIAVQDSATVRNVVPVASRHERALPDRPPTATATPGRAARSVSPELYIERDAHYGGRRTTSACARSQAHAR